MGTDGKGLALEFAVYTADRGYGWIRKPESEGEERLAAYVKAVNAMRPDVMPEGGRFEGVLCDGRRAAAFSAQRPRAWDSAGRAAWHYAFAFLERADCGAVDFAELLSMREFAVPSKTPPERVLYAGGASAEATREEVEAAVAGKFADGFDFRKCGDLFARHGHRAFAWRAHRTEPGGRSALECDPNPFI